jgi:BAAT / Acyl-CoA thioester hydrolase C terminal
VWPSTQLAQVAMDRFGRYERPYRDKFRHYPDAGHGIQPPYLPATPRNLITSAEISRATQPPMRIPGGACSACSMDVCGAEVFARSA